MEVTINGMRYVPHLDLEQRVRTMRQLRALSPYTLTSAAKEIGCSKSHLWGVEKGRSEPGILLAKRIAELYGVSILTVALAVELSMRSNTQGNRSEPA